ncbi:MAG TPA: hypothetical protein VN756_07145 [Solirubrobacterales bacterium]|nr:hypothetical protein [Solirubrobacterales bacterium]
MAWLRRNPPIALLGLALVVSTALLLWLGRDLTYFQDSWAFLLERRGTSAGDFLRPHNEHISVIPVAIQKLLLALFGMESDLDERIVLTVMLGGTAVLLFAYVRRLIGPWPALFAAVVLLFLGPAWEVLLWPFEISLAGSVLAGLGALLVLDRDDRRGDAVACVLLVVAIGFSSLGIPFVVAALVDLLQRRRDRGWARAYVPCVPLLFYGTWYIAYGREAKSAVSLHSVLHAPIFVAEGIASSLASILGLRALAGGIESQQRPYLGLLVLLALLGLVLYLARRRSDAGWRLSIPKPAPGLWAVLAATLAFWGLAGINDLPGRAPWASRYMHVGAIFVFLVLANLLAGVKIGKRALLAAGAVVTAAAALNLVPLVEGRDRLEEQSILARTDLAAIEIASRSVDPKFWLTPELAGTVSLINVTSGPYLAAVSEHGSPAYTPAELARAPELGRRQADVVLAAALPLATWTLTGTRQQRGGDCTSISGSAAASNLRLAPGLTRIEVAPGPKASLGLRRFATGEYPVSIDGPGGSTALLRIPPDAISRPWRLQVEAEQRVRVCA